MKSSPPHTCISVAKAWERNGWQTALLFLRDRFSQEVAFPFSERRSCSPNSSTLETWCWSLTLPTRTVTTSQGTVTRCQEEETLQCCLSWATPACLPSGTGSYSTPPHQQPAPLPRARGGGAQHSGSVLTSQCSANFSQPNQLNQGLDTSLFQSPPPSWLVVWMTTKAGACTASWDCVITCINFLPLLLLSLNDFHQHLHLAKDFQGEPLSSLKNYFFFQDFITALT